MKKITKIYSIFLIFIFLINSVYAININIEPTNVNFDNVLSSGRSEKTILIYTDSEAPIKVSTSIRGELKDWIKITSQTDFSTSKNLPLKLKLLVNPTSNIENKVYNGELIINILNQETPKISTYIGDNTIFIPISLQISNQEIKKVDVKNIIIRDIEEDKPFDVQSTITNLGNKESKIEIEIEIEIENSQGLVDSLLLNYIVIESEDDQIFSDNIDMDLGIGDYIAKIKVTSNEVTIREYNKNFKVLESGSLLKKINLVKVVNDERIHIGDYIRANIYLENVGEVSTFSKFKGKVYLGNSLIQEIESNEIYISIGEVKYVFTEFTPSSIGEYKIVGQIFYEDTATDEKEFTVKVVPESELLEPTPLATQWIIIALLGIVALFIYFRRKTNMKNG